MKKTLICLAAIGFSLPNVQAQDRGQDQQNNNRSSVLTPNAPRKVTMASPNKPAWLAEPHGK